MRVLHVISRWVGGGPERHLLALASFDRSTGGPIERRVLVLDRPLSMPLLVQARRNGMHLVPGADAGTMASEVAAADVVDVTFWNHPAMFALLRRPWPPCRVVLRSTVAGDTLPQVLGPRVAQMADLVVASAPEGYGPRLASANGTPVRHVPALADMTRLDGYAFEPGAGVRVGVLGSLSPAKLHPHFADIVAGVRSADVRFDLYGDGGENLTVSLTRALAARGHEDRVRFHGQVEDVARAFAAMDVFAHPLAPGGYATSEKALQEAMWVGVPPVVMAGTAVTRWIEHGVTGLLADDARSFAAAIDQLARNPALRRRIGQAAKRSARCHFDPARNAARLRAWFEEVATLPKRPWRPLPGADWSAAHQFLQSLEPLHDVFLDAVEDRHAAERMGGDRGQPVHLGALLQGEGGVAHYANTHPGDAHLRTWAWTLERRRRLEG